LLLFGSRVVQTIMRQALAPLMIYLCYDISCTPQDQGKMLSSFSLGYVSTQVIGGLLADKVGGKVVVFGATLLAGIATLATPMGSSVDEVWAIQVLMGAFQGPLFPTSVVHLQKWCPQSERSWASTLLDSGIQVGAMIALPLSGAMAVYIGWQGTFHVYGALACGFGVLWLSLAEDDPQNCSYITDEELQFLNDNCAKLAAAPNNNDKTEEQRMPVLAILSHPCIWAIYIAHFGFNFGAYFLINWSPTYLKEEFGIMPEHAALHLMLPQFSNLLVKVFVNQPLGKWLTASGFSQLQCRRFFTVVPFVGCAFTFVLIHPLKMFGLGPWCSTVLFTIFNGLNALHPAGFKANYMDVTAKNGGLVSGVGNTVATLGAYLGPLWIAYVLSIGNWGYAFVSVAICNLVAALVYGTLSSTTPVDNGSAKKSN